MEKVKKHEHISQNRRQIILQSTEEALFRWSRIKAIRLIKHRRLAPGLCRRDKPTCNVRWSIIA
ncbi:hypothetical protein KIN20_024304 [Parelaphostrongylus tenuis]|uniref:Uncharacterized protein n=1 Tax=Parelaphostrongylus tenuis TaxID=148309 RepID=A0AAD5QW83_PARTN|nr:hypothetical protein KIN20_024304 [Parelaphostrongylus tenuis]